MVLKYTFRSFHGDKIKKQLLGLTAMLYCLNKTVCQGKALSPFSGFWIRLAPSLP